MRSPSGAKWGIQFEWYGIVSTVGGTTPIPLFHTESRCFDLSPCLICCMAEAYGGLTIVSRSCRRSPHSNWCRVVQSKPTRTESNQLTGAYVEASVEAMIHPHSLHSSQQSAQSSRLFHDPCDWNMCRSIDPSNHPWPFLDKYGSPWQSRV